ncbi:Protein MEMO1 [Strongyloides ratti]|uniref:Protein MEMO1 n=1 Tax=Strongyloides ratti TaxID=34506 RepID=A0A090L0S5_STRRB|nr:Protein MEMO1 [Strongyloides ratti]CEF63271.1 Protein MEMO1 [Strongyloides ratti]
MAVRSASHAGSWYNGIPKELNAQLDAWLLKATERKNEIGAKAIISPHAGYTYCGKTAAYGFKQINPINVKKIFVLGPSHCVYLKGCALTTCHEYETPFGNLKIDLPIVDELKRTGEFLAMDTKYEEDEHSIEMQLPFIAKIMTSVKSLNDFSIIPVLVGSVQGNIQKTFGSIFHKYIISPETLFVISSDFCHWGKRFDFYPHNPNLNTPIWQQIQTLDKNGMNAIETLDPDTFDGYMNNTQNTICGSAPIRILLSAVKNAREKCNIDCKFEFLNYSQSSQITHPHDSSVSYASGVLWVHNK